MPYMAHLGRTHPDTGAVEWLVCRFEPTVAGPQGGISLHQCPECFALVVEDHMASHQAWHARG